MNFLAHAKLSFGLPGILTGNMISDFVKGSKKFGFSHDIQVGIQLHRDIDSFTDGHKATHTGKKVFQPFYRLYAGAFMDVVYDHFLALDEVVFKEDNGLNDFCENTYLTIQQNIHVCPISFQLIFPYMREQNWLYNYQFQEGLYKSMAGLVRRASYMSDTQPAIESFNKNYELLKECYQSFFPDVRQFAVIRLSNLMKD